MDFRLLLWSDTTEYQRLGFCFSMCQMKQTFDLVGYQLSLSERDPETFPKMNLP
jgi:hypothetical protein